MVVSIHQESQSLKMKRTATVEEVGRVVGRRMAD